MSVAQPPGRRTESLFDNRYRYDHIYPRGRSGETLRAYDTHANDRPVVIKRPAPQDAPPMRAGQEVSIRTEKQALERLSGHDVLTELRGSGTFRVGGHTHEYIVMDLAQGQIVEDMVLALAGQQATLPELEILVIVDRLLDLLAYAHDRQVIYNDVDSKHLFWDRETYHLKVIDWGNAVFVDDPGAHPNVNRSTDVYQCGELLYFILTGGNRLVVETEDDETFFVNFGPTAEHIPAKLQTIITRAVNPDPKRRYGTITELRQALADYRQPLEKARDEIVARVRKRVRATASQEELEELARDLQVALDMDPGCPDARALAGDIQLHLRQIAIQADLDAIRIYLESGNWTRAASLLHELLPGADSTNEPLIRFLIAASSTLENLHITPPPDGFLAALDPLFEGDTPAAGRTLLTTPDTRSTAYQAQWLLAEELATLVTDVTLLRPHLARLRHSLRSHAAASSALALLDEIEAQLDRTPVPGLTGLQVIYQQAGENLDRLEKTIESLTKSLTAEQQEAALASVIRARRAANELIRRLDEVGHHVYSDPSHAGDLLHYAAMIDPTSPYFEALHDYFDEIHQAIAALTQYKPRSDGTNLATWFADVREFLQPYLDDVPDAQFHAAAAAIAKAAEGWTTSVNYLALGRRQPTIDALHNTAEIIRPFNEHVAAWLGTVANRLPDASFVERHSPNTRLGDLLIDGWRAWDQGNIMQAAEFGRQAYDQATTDGERLAADRLRRLAELVDSWLVQNGYQDIELTDRAETESLAILLSDEENERRTFAEQMPNTALYLRAMGRGIVAHMQQSSSAGWRVLYIHYVLRGMLSLLEDNLSEAEFWRDAARNTYEKAPTHRPFQLLDRALTGRRLIQRAERAFNAVSGPADLETVREAINAPLATEWLTGAEPGVQMIAEALRDWSDGNFGEARQALDAALEHIETAIQVAGFRIEPFVTWLTELRDDAADLQQARLVIEQGAVSTSEEVDPALADAHQHIVDVTLQTLGSDYAHQVRQWDDMYLAVLDTYTTQRLTRREKLAAFNRHFTSLFINKHPAYPLFRHWEAITEELPPDDIEDSLIAVDTAEDTGDDGSLAYLEDDREPEPAPIAPRAAGGQMWNRIIWGAVAVLVIAVALAAWRLTLQDDAASDRPAQPTATLAPAAGPETADVPAVVLPPTRTPVPNTPTLTPTQEVPTATPSEAPTATGPPTITPTLFVTSTIVPSDTPAPLPTPEAVAVGPNRDMLAGLSNVPPDVSTWAAGALEPGENGVWRLSTGAAGTLTVEFSPEVLSAALQPGVANMITRADAVLELVDYAPAAMSNGNVAFGLGAINTLGQQAIAQVEFQEPNFVSLGMNQNNQFRSRTEAPQQNPQMRLSVRRTDANTLGFYVDEKFLGDSVMLFVQGQPITLVLYVSGQDVVVEVSEFEIEYSPRSELP
jgi:hypothetical protein